MLKVYFFIELLGSADAREVRHALELLDVRNGTVRKVVEIADDKLVAYIDCETGPDATRAVLENVMSVDGVVQASVIAVVRPKDR